MRADSFASTWFRLRLRIAPAVAVIMPIAMRSMAPSRRINLASCAGSAAIVLASFAAMRTRAVAGNASACLDDGIGADASVPAALSKGLAAGEKTRGPESRLGVNLG